MLSLYAAQLDSLGTQINRSLANFMLETDFDDPDFDVDEFSRQLSTNVLLYANRFSFFYSCPADGQYIFRTASDISAIEQEEVSEYFYALQTESTSEDWLILSLGENAYMLRYYYQDGRYLGAWISLRSALKLYTDNQFSSDAVLIFTDSQGQPLTSLTGLGLTEDQFQNEAWMEKEYMILSVSSVTSELRLTLLIPYETILKNLNIIQSAKWILLLAVLLCIPILFQCLKGMILDPLDQLTCAMNKVESGDYTVFIPEDQKIVELRTMGVAFNRMSAEINHLKVDIYEKEIFNQRLELETLQQQVKPHFYLNCLNIIYNLAEGEEYSLIQELCMAQVKYFRYMLKSSFQTVSIQEEFDHIKNYLHIQQLRYPNRFFVDLVLQNDFKDMKIPPLLLHVFAENAVKHASVDGNIHFNISTSVYDDTFIKIQISDDGPGFPPETLEHLNSQELSTAFGEQIGISNTIKRLNLFYNGNFRITFSNQRPHGALIQILIPKKEVIPHEHSDY
ncbi:MAG: histidine kinase [Clostridiales bacterium]|nr:histidine kinase [Clostridiales bacterium]